MFLALDRQKNQRETTNRTSYSRAAAAACVHTHTPHTHSSPLMNTSRDNRPLVLRDSTLSNILKVLLKSFDWLDRRRGRGRAEGEGVAYCTSRRVPGLARHFGLREGDDFRPLTNS